MGIFGKKTEDEVKNDATTVATTDKAPAKKTSTKKEKKADAPKSIAAAYGVMIAPIVTEKAHHLVSAGKYTFRVAKNATKAQIKSVVEEMYSVTVENVHVVVVKPKRRTVKYNRGYQSLYKKAIVTLKKGDHITVFEGA